MNYIDKKINQFATYLQKRNNLDHIQFLKIRLGLQVVVSNINKTIVTYGIAIFMHMFWYTLVMHIAYMMLRFHAHGAHAKSALLCYIQNIIIFILLPWLMIHLDINMWIYYILSFIGLIIVITYAPAATKKQPIPKRLVNRKKIFSISIYVILSILSLIIKQPFAQLIILGLLIETISLLPIFFSKEDK
ncbi:accessory gene regulator AgrB [Staphylococcus simiae]|uniref:accessory gene regulator AgrB n=1 Tax=Staphylococcus simiae TaxID=308354 RepID=UPI001A958CD1|nr:accessory gene regulator AgrB [Staphylococcus simiae]MBO1198326.1 accessory gene regulator AgrB [Staphylococcus simiae]MBO1200382.1 accessory gene regulator AgrB [Staphylococcus simiae]MBO1202655.1 accessory gene regulator AgrB [Staphylococcus simiae]MBO1210318.1 accessory gene regulator AgrB [Staphylococcus simiae]MBO1228771.1 accessory gene regulator AgrB [Staphylococcus simiae]